MSEEPTQAAPFTHPEGERIIGLLRAAIEAAGLRVPPMQASASSDNDAGWLVSVEDDQYTVEPTTVDAGGEQVPGWYASYLVVYRGSRDEPDYPEPTDLASNVSVDVVIAAVVEHMLEEARAQQADEESSRREAEEEARLDEELRALPHQGWCPMAGGGRSCNCIGFVEDDGEMTAEDYAASDFAFDAAREKRVFGGGRGRRW